MRSFRFLGILFFIVCLGFAACKTGDKKSPESSASDVEAEAAIEDMLAQEASKSSNHLSKADSVVIEAYKEDKTTISINDLDGDGTQYSMQAKNLYRSEDNGKYALVIGLMMDANKMGKVIVQKEGEKSFVLPQTKKMEGSNVFFSDGKNSLDLKGTEGILTKDGKTVRLSIVQ